MQVEQKNIWEAWEKLLVRRSHEQLNVQHR